MAEERLYPTGMTPDFDNETDGESSRILGTVFFSDIDTYMIAAEWFAPVDLPSVTPSMSVWSLTGDDPAATTGTRLGLKGFTGLTGGGWRRADDWDTPIFLPAGVPRYVQVHTSNTYTFSSVGDFPFDSDNGTLHAYAAAVNGNGRWSNGAGWDNDDIANNNYPGGDGYNFFVGIITDPNPFGHSKGAEFLSFF